MDSSSQHRADRRHSHVQIDRRAKFAAQRKCSLRAIQPGDGQLGLLALTVSPAVFNTLSAVAFVHPVNPGTNPVIPPGATTHVTSHLTRVFATQKAIFSLTRCERDSEGLKRICAHLMRVKSMTSEQFLSSAQCAIFGAKIGAKPILNIRVPPLHQIDSGTANRFLYCTHCDKNNTCASLIPTLFLC